MRIELTLYIDYDSGDIETIKKHLHDAAEHLYDNGLLTGNDPSIRIKDCVHDVKMVIDYWSVSTYNWTWGATGPEGEKK